MAEQKEAIQKILSDAGVEEPEEIADKIVALFPKTPAKRPRSDVSEINAKRANLSADSDSTTFKFCVTNNDAGSIIGKGGTAIAALRESSGAHVQLSQNREYFPGTENRVIMATGNAESVLKAFSLVIERRFEIYETGLSGAKAPFPEPNSIVILIPAAASGVVIGKGGENIKEIIAESGARVQLANKDARIAGVEERAVTIGGTKDQQIKAGELIFSLMQETIQTSTYKNMSTNYGHQQPEYGHQPRAPAYSSYPPPQYRPYASRYSPAPATSPRIPQRTGAQQTITMQVPDSIVGALVGKGGKVIIEMQQQSGAKIQISNREQMVEGTTDRVVTITGNDHAVATAQYLVNQKMQQTHQARAQYQTAAPAYAAVASY